MNEYESDKDSDASRPYPSDEYNDGCSLDFKFAAQNQYYGRWAAEMWLLRVYLRRCCRFLLSKLRPAKPVNNTSDDEVPF